MDSETTAYKKQAAQEAARLVEDGMVVGLGTGSTADYATDYLGLRKLKIRAIPTSAKTDHLARELGIHIVGFSEIEHVDILIDGADECTTEGQMIKGGGGALLREKLVASIAKRRLYVMDESKLVSSLGKFSLPVEVNRFGWEVVSRQLVKIGFACKLRRHENELFITDNGHYILDCSGKMIENPRELDQYLNSVVGIVEHGLFVDVATEIFSFGKDGLQHYSF